MSKLLTTLVAIAFAVAASTPVAQAADKGDTKAAPTAPAKKDEKAKKGEAKAKKAPAKPKGEAKKGEGKKTEGKGKKKVEEKK
jgi:hypothetical protein